jgi:hypothetical protein
VVFSSHVYLSTLTGLTRSFVNVLACCVRSYELNCLNILMGTNLSNCVGTALDHVNDSIWYTGLVQQINQNLGSSGNFFAWLEYVSITESDTEREHPKWNHRGEVKWCDTCNNS